MNDELKAMRLRKILLDVELRMEGMKAENDERIWKGMAPGYDEHAFDELACELENRFNAEYQL